MFSSDKIVAIDIGASNLRVGIFNRLKSGAIELMDFAVESVSSAEGGEEDRTELTMALRNLMRENGIKPGPVLLTVSGQQVFSRFVRLPPVNEEKIDQIVRYEAQQNVPFPINEVVWDYQLIGGVEGEVDVMLAAIKADISESICSAVMEAGLDPEIIDVAPLALYNVVRYNYEKLPACTLVVDVGARSTDLIFIEEGRVFNRSIPVGGNTITRQVMKEFDQSFEDAEEIKKTHGFVALGGAYESASSEVADKVSKSVRSAMNRLHAEISRSVNFYRTQQEGTSPGLVLLTGGSSVLPYMDKFLEEKLSVKVEFLNPFQNVAVAQDIDDNKIGSNAHLLGEVAGLALRKMMTCPIEISLIPESVLAQRALRRKMPFFVASAFCLVLVLAVWCGYFLKLGGMAERRLDVISERARKLESVESQMEKVESRIDKVQNKKDELLSLWNSRSEWMQVLQAVHERLPPGMWITSMKLREKEQTAQASRTGRRGGRGSKRDQQDREGGEEVQTDSTVIEVSGLAYADMHSSQSVPEFVSDLRVSNYFGEKTDITWLPARDAEDYLVKFQIDIVLSEAVEI